MSIQWLDQKLYPGFNDNWDDQLFRQLILKRLESHHHILDVGAGAGIVPQVNFLGRVQRVCGIDPDNRVVDNPYLNEGRVSIAEKIPYPENSFDLVFSDNVLEHLENPLDVFQEVCRVLKPGGYFMVKTPNKFHYMPFIARVTPHWFHRAFNRMRGREAEDTFPTKYRANSARDFQDLCYSSKLLVESIQLVEGRPEYLRFSSITYIFGWMYERMVNRFDEFARFRVLLIGEFRKPDVSYRNT